jgi:hypothetical protein
MRATLGGQKEGPVKNLHKMPLPIRDIVQFIVGRVTPDRSVLVGIDGRAGSGGV